MIDVLNSQNILARNASILSICSAGHGKNFQANLEDIELKNSGSPGLMKTAKQESSLADAFHEKFAIQNPEKTIIHMSPGLVNTNNTRNLPWHSRILLGTAFFLLGASPDSFSQIPVHLLEQGKRLAQPGFEGLYFEKDHKIPPCDSTRDVDFRRAVFQSLRNCLEPAAQL